MAKKKETKTQEQPQEKAQTRATFMPNINYVFASQAPNKSYTNNKDSERGFLYEADCLSAPLNGVLNYNQNAIKQLQKNGGYYDPAFTYEVGDIVLILCYESGSRKYRTAKFLCKAAHSAGSQKPLQQYTGSHALSGKVSYMVFDYNSAINTTYWEQVF